MRYKPIDIWFGGGNCYVWPRLDATRLKLRWGAFPRPVDRSPETNGIFAQVGSVTYDLRIWRGLSENQVADELVYAREALPNPFHQVEDSLPRSAWYFWSVRARFEVNGQTRVTEWSHIQSPEPTPRSNPRRTGINYPDPRFYRFYLR